MKLKTVAAGTPVRKAVTKTASRSALVHMLAVSLAACGSDGKDDVTANQGSGVSSGQGNGTTTTVTTPTPAPEGQTTPQRVSLEISSAEDARTIQDANIDIIDAVFKLNASVDSSNMTRLSEINIGLDGNGNKVASDGRADFDRIVSKDVMVNIHASSGDLELDFEKGANAKVVVNFVGDDLIILGDADFIPGGRIPGGGINPAIGLGTSIDLTVRHSEEITLQNSSASLAVIQGHVELDETTKLVTIQTFNEGGDIEFSNFAGNALVPGSRVGFLGNGTSIEHINILAENGNIDLLGGGIVNHFGGVSSQGEALIRTSDALQTVTIQAVNADIRMTQIGESVRGGSFLGNTLLTGSDQSEFEKIDVTLDSGSTLYFQKLNSLGPIAEFSLQTSGEKPFNSSGLQQELISDFTFVTLPDNINVFVHSVDVESVGNMVIETSRGGTVLFGGLRHLAHDQTFIGTGDIYFGDGIARAVAIDTGLKQTKPVDASQHTGDRVFFDGSGNDVIFGSDKNDTIFFYGLGEDVYNDAGGDDLVMTSDNSTAPLFGQIEYFGSLTINDGSAGSNDTYFLDSTFSIADYQYNAGSGNDTLILGWDSAVIDFGNWISGTTAIKDFAAGFGQTFSFDGLPGMTTTQVNDPAIHGFNENSIYVIANGDAAISSVVIGNYSDLANVANYLDVFTDSAAGQTGDSAVFVVNNGTVTGAPGDEHDAYIYYYYEDGAADGIQGSNLSLIATVDISPFFFGLGVSASDIG